VNENSEYNSRLIDELQEEIPFTIIIPTYFPDGIPTSPTGISRPFQVAVKGSASDEYIAIGLSYEHKDAYKCLYILEDNRTATYLPSKSSSIYLDIEGIQVLEEECAQFLGPNNNELLTGTRYAWNSKPSSRIEVGYELVFSGIKKVCGI
jgi:hypothetical protein